jgi:hypothetical protein
VRVLPGYNTSASAGHAAEYHISRAHQHNFSKALYMHINMPKEQLVLAALSGVRQLGDTGLAWLEAADDVLTAK